MLQISPLVVPAAACALIGGVTLGCVILAEMSPREAPRITVFSSAPAPIAVAPRAVAASPAKNVPAAALPAAPQEEKIFPGRKLKKKPGEKAPASKERRPWMPDDDDDDDD